MDLKRTERTGGIAPVCVHPEALPVLDDNTKIQISACEGLALKGIGMTGRQTASDMYGDIVPHGSGALSGKGPEHPKRLGAYLARYIAKNMVAAGLARQCQVTLGYAVGVREPVLVQVDTFGTGEVCADDCLVHFPDD